MKDGQPLALGATLAAAGVVDNDFLFLVRDSSSNAAARGAGGSAAVGGNGGGGGGGPANSLADLPRNTFTDPALLINTLHDNPRLLKVRLVLVADYVDDLMMMCILSGNGVCE